MNIHGAKKGQATPRQPVIAPDSAQSKTFINMLFGLGEGEIAGLANGYKSVYLDNTPLQNDNGEFNFANIKVDFRSGTNDQEYIDGFADVSSETAVGVELKYGTPWVKSLNNLDLDALRVRLKWGALRSQNAENGDVGGVNIDYAIDVKTDNGGWTEVLKTAINAKTSDAYERSHRIELPTAQTGWQVRVRRLTPNSTSDLVSDKMYVSAITEVIDLKLRYPNTALLGLRYDAETFSNVAKMSARCKGLIIKVPSNYNPETRTYTGLWDGTFKMAYSNNPAWVYYDLCTAERYGLGGRLKAYMIDKWSLYRLAQYCDEMVDDGMGGLEPRFAVNVYIQSSEGAFEILSKLAGVFRAISYWDGNSIVVDADIPQDSIYSFSRANVIDGVFEYTGTRARDRHTVAKIAWDNPANHFKTEYEFVRDEAAIAKFGVRVADIAAWGCTSKGQAQRAGLWALKSEQLETRMVSFKVGLDGYIPAPAKVIEISDELFAGRANGGRVVGINKTKTVITLDRTITAKAGDTLVINGNDGLSQRRQIRSVNGDKVTVTNAFGDISVENVWVLDSSDLATMKFRVLSVTADDNHTFTITAVQYNPAKYDAIDTGAYIDERPISAINPTAQAPTRSVNLSSYHTVNQGVSVTTLVIGWEQAVGAVKYAVEWRKDNGNWVSLPPTGTNSIEITGVYAGSYEARVTAIGAFGQASTATHSALTTITGKQGKPTRLARLSAKGVLFGMDLNWVFGTKSDDTNFTEIQVSPDGRSNISTLGQFAYPTNKHEITGLQGNLTQFYRARIVDKLGNVSDWTAWVSGTTSAEADKVLDLLAGQITTSQLHQELSTPIAKIGTLETGVNLITPKVASLENSMTAVNSNLASLNANMTTAKADIAKAKTDLSTAIGNITTERNRISQAIADITTLQSANNAKTLELANLTQTVGGHTSSIRDLAVTTGDLTQKYTQLKSASDNANSEITAIKQTQSGQATQISMLGSRFDSLSVGGRNLLLGTAEPKSLAGENRTNQSNVMFYAFSKQPFSQFAKTDFVLSFDWEVLGDVVQGRFVPELNQHPWSAGARNIAVSGTNKQGRYEYKYSNTDLLNTTATHLKFRLDGFVGTLVVRNVKLEIGTIATDWTPAPEDIDAQFVQTNASISTLQQTVTNADNALSQRIDTLDASYKQADTTLNASITAEQKARADGDTALTSRIDSLTSDYNSNKASVASRLKTLSDKDTATASQITSLQANVTTAQNTANTATTKADNAQATANNALSRANTANSAITAEQKARADADSSLASQITALDTAYKQADTATNAKLANAEKAISDNNTALSQRITALDTAYKKSDTDITARLAREESARANGDNANSQAIRTLESTVNSIGGRVGTSESKIATLERTTSDTNQALATAQSQLNARFDSLSVGGRNLLLSSKATGVAHTQRPRFYTTNAGTWRATLAMPEDGVLRMTRVQTSGEMLYRLVVPSTANMWGLEFGTYTFSGKVRTNSTDLIIQTSYHNGSRWNDTSTGNIASENWTSFAVTITIPDTAKGWYCGIREVSTISGNWFEFKELKLERGNIATDWTPAPEDIDSATSSVQANLDEFKRTEALANSALSQRIDSLNTSLGTKANAAALNDLITKVNQVDGKINAEASKISTLQTTVNGQTASIQQHSQSINGLSAQWTLKAESNGIVSGIGLASSNGVSDFAVRANKFYVVAPTGTTKQPLFSVLTTATTINGVSVPAGVYLSDGYIQNGTITNAKIANGAISSAKIGNAQITNAQIANGAITTAKIGNAQVDTLQIAGEAVIVPRVQFTQNEQSFYSIDTEEEINRISLDAQGGAVAISFGFERLYAKINNRGNDPTIYLRIKRGSTVLRTLRFKPHNKIIGIESYRETIGRGDDAYDVTRTRLAYADFDYEFITLPTITDNPPSGLQTYTITLESRGLNAGKSSSQQADTPVAITARSLQVMAVKR